MKRTHGSESFIIYKKSMTEDQMNKVLGFQGHVRSLISSNVLGGDHAVAPGTDFPMTPFGYLDDQWEVEDMGNRIYGATVMNNFDMAAYLKYLSIPEDAVIWRDYN